MPTLLRIKPGTRFRLREAPEVTGMLIKATECRAVVRLDRPVQEVEFVDGEGQPRLISQGTTTIGRRWKNARGDFLILRYLIGNARLRPSCFQGLIHADVRRSLGPG